MKITDTIVVGAIVIIFAFPMMFLIMLLGTGNAKLMFKGDLSRAVEVQNVAQMQQSSKERDSLLRVDTYAFEAKVEEGERVVAETDRMIREQERLNILIAELRTEREKLEAERKKMEGAIDAREVGKAQAAANNNKRITELARVYQEMKPKEAAQILETLSDNLTVQILKSMTDDRQKARILAAMDTDRAGEISRKMR
jgi:flagellar motility protein MotE (MotC chaperone)